MIAEECNIIVLDFDGVVVKENLEIREIGRRILSEAKRMGLRIYIVTGRHKREVPEIRRILREAGGRAIDILARPEHGIAERDWKLSAYEEVLDKEGCIAEIHDDNPYVLESARRLGINALVLHSNETCEVIYGKSVFSFCEA